MDESFVEAYARHHNMTPDEARAAIARCTPDQIRCAVAALRESPTARLAAARGNDRNTIRDRRPLPPAPSETHFGVEEDDQNDPFDPFDPTNAPN